MMIHKIILSSVNQNCDKIGWTLMMLNSTNKNFIKKVFNQSNEKTGVDKTLGTSVIYSSQSPPPW